MKLSILIATTLVACAIHTEANSLSNKRQPAKIRKRQTNADQMVQNILQWLQTVYSQNSRRIRQGTLREYLPPANTEKPRPFQPGYPAAGYSPVPSFPFPTNPATGGVIAPEEYQPEGQNEVLLPPEQGSGGGEHGYVKPEPQPGFTYPSGVGSSDGPTTAYPAPSETDQPSEKFSFPGEQPTVPTSQPDYPTTSQPGYSTSQPGYSTGQPDYSTSQPGYPTGQPGYPTNRPSYTTGVPGYSTSQPTFPSEQPGPFPTHPAGIPHDEPSETTTKHPGYPAHNGYTETTPGVTDSTQPGGPVYTSPPGTQPPREGTTGYPAPGPQPTPEFPTRIPSAEQPITTLQSEAQPGSSTILPIIGAGSTYPTPSNLPVEPQPAIPEEPVASGEPGHVSTLTPSGFTASTPSAPVETEKPADGTPEGHESETAGSTVSPEANTIPGPGKPEPVVDEEDLKHPPHIHAIDVQCSKEMMTINIEFNRVFNGVIYSKGFYNNPECRYVQENSGQTKYMFTVNLAMCGTEFVNAFDTQNQSYLENVLVLQNELGIQEVWDTVRSVRCLWEGNLKDTLSVAFSIGMLSQEIITFSGDTAMAKLDVVLGRGPFGEPANGLVKIGEQMTLVVSVSGDPGFDLQVKDCKAIDSDAKNAVALTDENGCILKPKLFGAFQKTKETGDSGASIIAYAYFNAFKFPDEMDLMIECNIELCKTDCDICSKENQQLEPARRRRRDISYNTTLSDGMTMGKHLRVILPEDLNEKTALEITLRDNICMSVQSFVFSTAVLVSLLVISSFASVCLWLKRGEKKHLKY